MFYQTQISFLLMAIFGSAFIQNVYVSAEAEVENSTVIGTPEDGSSELSDVSKQPMTSDVFRQLLNQETLIRMTLVKNVNSLMLDMVSMKDSVLSMQKNMEQIAKVSIDDIMGLKLENKKLKDSNELLKGINIKHNRTISELLADVHNLRNGQVQYTKEMRDRDDFLQRNTSAVLTDLNTNIRILSMSLVNVDKQSQNISKRLKEVDESLPVKINEKFSIISETVKNISNQLSERTNDSLQTLKMELDESNQNYLRLSAGVLSLEWFKNNISGKCDIQKRIGFTAGMRSSDSSWSSGKLIFNKVLFNQGNGYNSTSGVFTAPSSGVYVFYISVTSNDDDNIKVDIILNGNSLVTAWGNGQKERLSSYRSHYHYNRYQTGTNMAVLPLRLRDKVWVQYRSGNGFHSNNVPVTTFSGFVI